MKFLNEVIEKLGLEGIETVHGRAEDGAKKPELREAFDLSVTRAVARVSVISEYCLPYVKTGGYFAAYKSGKAAEELEEGKKAIAVLGGKVEKTEEFLLPDSDMERNDFADKKSKKYTEKVSEKSRNSCKRTDCISGKLDKKLYENKERKRAEKGSLFFIRDICKDSQKKHILI